jgi:hypothetical protein
VSTGAARLHREMLAAYRACDRYQDEGTVEGPLGRHWFRTDFVRSHTFLFEFGDWGKSDRRRVVFRIRANGRGRATIWRRRDRRTQRYSLSDAVAALTGVTSTASHCIPTLLMPELGGRTLGHLVALRLVGKEVVGGRPCKILEGRYPDRDDCTKRIWISTEVPWVSRVETDAPILPRPFVVEYSGGGV